MSLNINTNISALTAHRSMMKADNEMKTSLQRLSTGLRINSASDDASGMTIADALKSQHRGLAQGIRNANDAVSIVQTADGALEESINIVNIIKSKAIQAASDGQTADTRSALQADIDKLVEELNTIAKSTAYNGQQLLSGNFTNKHIQIGASSNETATINIGSTSANQTGHVSTAKLALNNKDGGKVQLTMTSAITGKKVKLETIEILKNNKTENGMGALADKINAQKYQTGIGAVAVVESSTGSAVQEGATGTDFAINGTRIGAINVKAGDNSRALVNTINKKTNETGVTASIEPDGSLTLRSKDGRAIKVTGDTGKVFGDKKAADMSTVGYLKLTQSGSSQFSIEGTTAGGTKNAITLSRELKVAGQSTLAAGSTIAKGSELKAGSVVGGNATVNLSVKNALSDYKLQRGSILAAGSKLSQGTVVGGKVRVSGDTQAGAGKTTTTVMADMKVAQGSVLAKGTTLGAGTVLTSDITQAGVTYKSGQALTTDLTLADDHIVKEDMTLAAKSKVAAGTTFTAGSVMGADMKIGMTWDGSDTPSADMTGTVSADSLLTAAAGATIGNAATLAKGSTLKDGSTINLTSGATYNGPTLETNLGTLKAGDTLSSNVYTVKGDQTITDDLTTSAAGAVLKQGSVIAKGSDVGAATVGAADYETATQTSVTITEEMTLKAKSDLAGGSVLAAGSTLGNDTRVAGESGDLKTHAETTLTAGSSLASGSELAKGSNVDGSVTVKATTLDNDMNLETGSVLKQDTLLKKGTVVTQDMTLNTDVSTGSGDKVEIKAGTVLTKDLYVNDSEVTLSKAMTLAKGSDVTAGSDLKIDTQSAGNLELKDLDSRTLADLSVMTQNDAQVAINIADAALKDLDKTRSDLGSTQSQLTSSIANMTVTKTNIKASESAIRDVDFAEETANYSRLKMLSQTSAYALAQANTSAQQLMTLMK